MKAMQPGDNHYKAYIGPPEWYDENAAQQFALLTSHGMKSRHKLLDIGCGSLRGGKLFIPYLDKGHYYGIEPNGWLVREGMEKEVGFSAYKMKQPSFLYRDDFELSRFDCEFDYILAFSVFSHTSDAQTHKCLAEAKKVLTPGGKFFTTWHMLDGTINLMADHWVYPGNVLHSKEHIIGVAAEHGFDAQELPTDYTGKPVHGWFMFTLKEEESEN